MEEKEENSKTLYGRPPCSPCWLLLGLLLLMAVPELLLHISTASDFSLLLNSGMVLPVLLGAVPALVLFTLFLLLPSRGFSFVLSLIYGFLTALLCASQLIYYRVFGCFYSVFSMANGGQILQFWNIILTKIAENPLWLLGMFLPFVLFCIWGRHLFYFRTWSLPVRFLPVLLAAAVQIITVWSLPYLWGTGPMSPADLYHCESDAYYSVNKLGLATAFRLDLTRLVTGSGNSGTIQLSTEPAETTEPAATETAVTETAEETTEPPVDTSPNVLDLDFPALIQQESDPAVREVHQYFNSRTPSCKNDHTGIFEGSNLILITGEAFSSLVIDPVRTPTLYKMMQEGYLFTDYYVPDWGTSTTDGEYAFLTGTIPKANTWSFSDSSDNAMPLTMCQQLMAQGYGAYAYHGHTYDYYNRNEYLENLGYTYRAYGQGLDVDYTWPESDIQVVEQSVDDYAAKEPFTAYYMSISGHREFNFEGNYISYKNRDLVKDEPYSEHVRAYLACQMELDRSLKILMDHLEQAGTLDNTVFVLTADHYPNGLTHEEISELLGHPVESNFEIFKNKALIYKPGMTPETITTPCSHLDLLPTLSNLFGLSFDSRLYMGRDIFSDASPLVPFRNRSWITDQASYNFSTGEVVNFTDTPVTQEYIEKINQELANRFTVSSRILDYDYWKILFSAA